MTLFLFGFSAASGVSAAEFGTVRVQLKWQHQFQFAGYYAALEKGYYQAAGLDVQLVPASSAQEPIDSVLNGRAEYGVGTSSLLLKRAQGKPVVVLAAFFQHSPLAIMALKKSGTENLHSLAKKKVMIESGSDELLAYLRREGIDDSEIKTMPHTFSLDDLLAGRVDAMSVYSTDEPYELARQNTAFVLHSPTTGGIDFYGDNLFTTEAEIAKHPERVKAFKEATIQGWIYAMSHVEEIANLIHQQYDSRHSIEHLRYEAKMMAPLLQTQIVEPGHMYVGRWQHIANVYAELGMLPKDFDLTGFVYQVDSEAELRKLRQWIVLLVLGLLAVFALYLVLSHQNRRISFSERRFKDLLETMPVAFVLVDNDDKVLVWNTAASKLFGWSAEEIVGQNPWSWVIPAALNVHIQDLLKETKERCVETHSIHDNLTKAGKRVTCEWRNTPFIDADGKVAGTVSLGVDVSDREQARRQLEEAKNMAEKLLNEQKQFLQMVSHEMRSPLAVVDTAAQIIEFQVKGEERTQELVQRIRRGVTRLSSFINQCISDEKLQQLSTNGLECHPEEINLRTLLANTADQIAHTASEHTIVIDAEDKSIFADASLLKMLLLNLIGNAIKYSPAHTEIRVVVQVAEAWVTLQVIDQGRGIPPGDVSEITKRYVRGDNSGQVSGLGLGLFIVDQIAKMHGGSMTIQSELGQGTTMTVIFPQRQRIETRMENT